MKTNYFQQKSKKQTPPLRYVFNTWKKNYKIKIAYGVVENNLHEVKLFMERKSK